MMSYDRLLRWFNPAARTRRDHKRINVLASGAIAGYLYWFAVFPIDVVKSRIQSDSFTAPKYQGMLDCFRKSFQEGGYRVFYKGFAICLLRAGPVNAGNFFFYEETMKLVTPNPTKY
eukprot:TRINITY_DN2834_c0_g1_i2.p1 TRINITY_DN2834_c0_g1~~TRINITY_DN2834_c0_g1_i2.p1  ORF type:complete len:117 (-),score=19.51 TRINITY_DN2834_c0_g1_i2:10-360(-)